MSENNAKIFPLGDAALTVSFGDEISLSLNEKVLNLAAYFEANRFDGFVETAPAYASLTVFYDVPTVRKNFPEFATAFEAVKNLAENALRNAGKFAAENSRLVEIPVDFSKEFAPDLDFVAAENNRSPESVIKIFVEKIYRVYMLGFLPGFAYMGEIDERIATARRKTPRADVSKGSVGIAGRQTGIYSLASPGGWQIIGRTNVELFTPNASSGAPTFLRAGDDVKFYAARL